MYDKPITLPPLPLLSPWIAQVPRLVHTKTDIVISFL